MYITLGTVWKVVMRVTNSPQHNHGQPTVVCIKYTLKFTINFKLCVLVDSRVRHRNMNRREGSRLSVSACRL